MTSPGQPTARRVLVTGAGGFIGSHLAADQARRGRSVVALDLDLDRVRHLARPGRFELLEGDVADPEMQSRALEGIDTVHHLAAAHLSVTAGAEEFRRVNVDGVRGLIERCRSTGVRRLVHCSTVGVFGRIAFPPANEETPCHPEIAYEKSKLEGEAVLREASEQQGFPVVILRPAWVYGPGCPRTEKLFRTIGAGRFVVGGKGDKLRHCVYIRDMVRAFDLASDADAALGQVVIVADDRAVTVRELVDSIARVTGSSPPRSVPLAALLAAGATAEVVFRFIGREPPLSRRTIKFFTANTAFETERARTLLGFAPRYGLHDGLEETRRLLERGLFSRVPLPETAAG